MCLPMRVQQSMFLCYLDGGMGNDPHFFLPLANGDHMCFSIQGEPDFAFNLIDDKYIQLNGQFVAPNEEDSHAIANVSTFLGDLGLVVKNPDTNGTTIIKVSACTRSQHFSWQQPNHCQG